MTPALMVCRQSLRSFEASVAKSLEWAVKTPRESASKSKSETGEDRIATSAANMEADGEQISVSELLSRHVDNERRHQLDTSSRVRITSFDSCECI